jgi:dihydroflavonol-4-reductase
MTLPGADEQLELVAADLVTSHAFDDAVVGCEYVLHTASPYELSPEDPQRDLVDPAVNGTVSVLQACVGSA